MSTGGTWDELSCGHYSCGNPPDCEAIVPGCDCGPDANFVKGVGCEADPLCKNDDAQLCEATGGVWDPLSCGHYICGKFPPCDNIDPGCDCGEGNNFSEEGCKPDPECG